MREAPVEDLKELESDSTELRLLPAQEPWLRSFGQNLAEVFQTHKKVYPEVGFAPEDFWPDVFVERELPWRRFFESGGYHLLAILAIWAGSRFLALRPQITATPAFTHADVIYYSASEYLPPLDTRPSTPARALKADPELSAQPIISVPREASNRSQTIVAAPNVRLEHDISVPNTIAWSDKPRMPIAPAPVVQVSEISRLAPEMKRSVIAPPPSFQDDISQKNSRTQQTAVIAPPPALDADSHRRLGDMNMGRGAVIAPAPQLPVDEQRTMAGRSVNLRGHSAQVIAPPPSVGVSGGARSGGGMIALSLHPTVGAPPVAAEGNRRGSFSSGPNGHNGASGTPGSSGGGSANASGTGANAKSNLPSGLYVGKTPDPASSVAGDSSAKSFNTVNPRLIANARPPRISRTSSDSDPKISEAERAVFAGRKIYSLSLNMPNLNSGGGSWIIHFAALKADSTPANPSGEPTSSDLSSPVATSKVDPAYPLELMKQNVSGTVILHAIILADGSVGKVSVLRSVDDRLDQFARDAIAKWQFQPATKNGAPVAVEATFWIPFRPTKVKSDF